MTKVWGGVRSRLGGRLGGHTAALGDQLQPVADRLLSLAGARAAAARAAAERDARDRVSRADADASLVIDSARRDGALDASRAAAARFAAAQRAGRELVLVAQRVVYDELRSQAIAALEQEADTPAGRALAQRLAEAARHRLGDAAGVDGAAARPGGAAANRRPFCVEVVAGQRSVIIEAGDVVDAVLGSLAAEVSALWR